MSGICGIIRFDGNPAALSEISRMTQAMAHRGPDGIAHWQGTHAALGHCLLRTTEEAVFEKQPIASVDARFVLTFDGTLWNAADIVADLGRAGKAVQSVADSAIVLAAFEVWGRSFLDRLDGDFALAIWDGRERELFCARDRIGMRPFHYHSAEWGFCFASDPEALIALPFVPRRLNEARIADAIVGVLEGYDDTSTLFEDLFRLPAAHTLIVRPTANVMHRYWAFQAPSILKLRSDADYQDCVRSVLKEAVRRRLRGGDATGAMLSGGLDSTSVAALGRRIRAEQGLGPLPTFSAVGPDPDSCVETRMIGSATTMGGIRPYYVDYSALGDIEDDLVDLTMRPTSPFDRHMTLVRAVYLRAQRAGCRAVLDGVGGDLVFAHGGYLPYLIGQGRWIKAVNEAQHSVWGGGDSAARRLFSASKTALIPEWARSLKRSVGGRNAHSGLAGRESFINPEFAKRVGLEDRLVAFSNYLGLPFAPGSPHRRAAGLFQHQVVASRERYEREAARVSIEPRDPYFDLGVLSLCFSLPVEQVATDGWSKSILRKTMSGHLPDDVCWRRGRTHLGWKYTLSILARVQTRTSSGIDDECDCLANYFEVRRLDQARRTFASGDQLSRADMEQLFAARVIEHWLSSKLGAEHPERNRLRSPVDIAQFNRYGNCGFRPSADTCNSVAV